MRVRKHIFDQMVALKWATERLISGKGKNHDFELIDSETQRGFLALGRFLEVLTKQYENFLWREAEKKERQGLELGSIMASLPDDLKVKLNAVQAYKEKRESVVE